MTTAAKSSSFTVERLAWVTAYLNHFASEPPAAVLEALGIRDADLGQAQREHLRVMTVAMRNGNVEPSTHFAKELSLARTKLAEQNPSLDDVRATYSRKIGALPAVRAVSPDETVMMRAPLVNMVLPFQAGEAAKAPAPAQPPPVEPPPGAGETTLAPMLDLSQIKALPFQRKPAGPGADPDDTMMAPVPKKPR